MFVRVFKKARAFQTMVGALEPEHLILYKLDDDQASVE